MISFSTPVARRWALVFTTLSLAFLSGHLMQSGPQELPASKPAPIVAPKSPVVDMAVLITPPSLSTRILSTRAERKGSCKPKLELAETPTGLLHVGVSAPCHAGAPIKVRFNDLVADATTDARGRWEKRVPPLAYNNFVKVEIQDHELSGHAEVERAADQQHVILAWSGAKTFQIRTDALLTLRSEISLGDRTLIGDGHGASFEIVSFPAGSSESAGLVRLSVDAKVTSQNCNRNVETIAYQTGYLGTLRQTELTYKMPDCERVGDVVRLQNLFRDVRLAAR